MRKRIKKVISKYQEFKLFHYRIFSFVIFILVCLSVYGLLSIGLILFSSFWKFLENAPSEQIVALSTLLGLTVGGVITYFTTHYLANRNRKIDILLKSKRTTFEPIYDEIRKLSRSLPEIGNLKYYFDRYLEYNTISGTSTARIESVLSDSRVYNLPKYLRKQLEYMIELTYSIEKQYDVASKSIKEVFRKFLEENDIELKYSDNRNKVIDPLRILGASNIKHQLPFEPNHISLSKDGKIDADLRSELIQIYDNELDSNSEYLELFNIDRELKNQIEYSKTLFTKLIALITYKYERMWR